MNNDTIVVLMPSLNMNSFFKRAYRDVLGQTYKNWVVYAMDAIGEKNEEIEGKHQDLEIVVNELNSQYGERINLFKQKSDGILGVALNELYEYAVSDGFEYFTFLAADDGWHKQKIEIMHNKYKKERDSNGRPLLLFSYAKSVNSNIWHNVDHDVNIDIDNISISDINWRPNGNVPVYSSIFFDKYTIDAKRPFSRGMFTSYDYPWLFDCEFYAEAEMSGALLKNVNALLTFYNFCNPETRSLGWKIHNFNEVRRKEVEQRNNLCKKLDEWRINTNNR